MIIRPTRRSSEWAPAGTPSGDADVAGGWLRTLTFFVRPLRIATDYELHRENQGSSD
jgi:hypothetical protein